MSALTKMTKVQKSELAEAVSSMKSSDFGVTAVKFELEAQLNRPYDNDSEYCGPCDGDGYTYCDCDEGTLTCPDCDGDWERYNEETEEDEVICHNCDEGYITCSDCGGDARITCSACDGTGTVEPSGDDWSEEGCDAFIKSHVPAYARNALIYGRFYNDGSVDSEFTFTLPIDKAHYAVHFIEAFKQLAEAVGNGLDVGGSGMHIAVLNDPNGAYGNGNDSNRIDDRKFANFKASMEPLLPALYFLASPSHDSRGLRYRPPKIDQHDKYAAISGSHRVLEYRIFETCYEFPLAVIDYLIVVSKSLRYYSDNYIDTSLKMGNLGIKDGRGLHRFFYTANHLKVLDKGLELLKPNYKTVARLKRERSFHLDEQKLKEENNKRLDQWREDFKNIKDRRKFERMRIYHRALADAYGRMGEGDTVNPRQFAREYVREYVSSRGHLKGDCRQYLREQTEKFLTQDVSYTIST